MYPRSGFRSGGTSAKTTLLEPPFCEPPKRRGRSEEETAGGHTNVPKASPRPRQPPLCSAGIELESACRARSSFEMLSQYPQSAFQRGATRGGQQQFATQTFRIHLLCLDLMACPKSENLVGALTHLCFARHKSR